jgi:flagellar biosynthesis chaperone FliJ
MNSNADILMWLIDLTVTKYEDQWEKERESETHTRILRDIYEPRWHEAKSKCDPKQNDKFLSSTYPPGYSSSVFFEYIY